MILSPIQHQPKFTTDWTWAEPKISQYFGMTDFATGGIYGKSTCKLPPMLDSKYFLRLQKYLLKPNKWINVTKDEYWYSIIEFEDTLKYEKSTRPHNGIDFAIPKGTPVIATTNGYAKVKNSGKNGYGLHIRIRDPWKALETNYSHLSEIYIKDGQKVNFGDVIGAVGSTGNSSGYHLHFGVRRLIKNKSKIFYWKIKDYDDYLYGYFNPLEFILRFKGTYTKNTL